MTGELFFFSCTRPPRRVGGRFERTGTLRPGRCDTDSSVCPGSSFGAGLAAGIDGSVLEGTAAIDGSVFGPEDTEGIDGSVEVGSGSGGFCRDGLLGGGGGGRFAMRNQKVDWMTPPSTCRLTPVT
jgi:hypothetical protein